MSSAIQRFLEGYWRVIVLVFFCGVAYGAHLSALERIAAIELAVAQNKSEAMEKIQAIQIKGTALPERDRALIEALGDRMQKMAIDMEAIRIDVGWLKRENQGQGR